MAVGSAAWLSKFCYGWKISENTPNVEHTKYQINLSFKLRKTYRPSASVGDAAMKKLEDVVLHNKYELMIKIDDL
jgi:hypothetical protein